MESCSNQKVVKQMKMFSKFEILQIDTLCLDDSFADSWHFSTSFTWNAFPIVLKEFPRILSTCWLLFLHSLVQLIPNHHNWV